MGHCENKEANWIARWCRACSVVLALSGIAVLLYGTIPGVAGSSAPTGSPVSSTAQSVSSLPEHFEHRNIEDVHVGDRMLARNPQIDDGERESWQEPDWTQWRLVRLEMTKPDGGVLKIEMIRPDAWFIFHDVQPGGEIFLDLREMGAQGESRVISVDDCPKIQPPPGQVVTATFTHPPSTGGQI